MFSACRDHVNTDDITGINKMNKQNIKPAPAKLMSLKQLSMGFTLIEMMVSIVVTSVLMAGVIQIFISSKQSYKLQESFGFLQDGGRSAIDLVTQDLRRAGYWGGNASLINITGTSAPIPVTGGVAGNFDDCPTGDTTWGRMLNQRVFSINESRGTYACIPASGTNGYIAGSGDVLTVRTTSSMLPAGAPIENGRLYLRSTLVESRLFTGLNSGSAANQIVLYNPGNTMETMHTLVSHAYYIGDSGATCLSKDGTSNDPIPSLYRVSIDQNGTPVTQRLFNGVENLQTQFGMDTDGDGVADEYRNAAGFDPDTEYDAWNWNGKITPNNIVTVRVWMLMRSECADPKYENGNKTYSLGDRTITIPAAGDGYRRQVYMSTITMRI